MAVDIIKDELGARLVIRRLAAIAIFAIILGFVMQGLVVAAKLIGGGLFSGSELIVDLLQRVTWSVLICAGVGIGTSIIKARAALTGFLAVVCAPFAVAAAKAVQKVTSNIIGIIDKPGVFPLATISVLRAVEYGLLGWLLATLATKEPVHGSRFFASGALIGVVFGGAIAILTFEALRIQGIAPTLPQMLATSVNEVVGPIGCAVVIYVSLLVGRNTQIVSGYRA